MRRIAVAMRIVNWLIVVLVSVFAALFIIRYEIAVNLFTYFRDNVPLEVRELVILSIALVLILFNLLALIGLGRSRYLKYITFSNPKGQVAVSIAALQEALTRGLLQHPQVEDAHVAIFVSRKKKKPIRVIASGVLKEANDIVAIEARIQDMLERRFKEILKVDEKVLYDIRLEKFKFEKPLRPLSEEKPIDVAGEPTFHGIQYPIEEEERS
jgi:hypothetical protein